MAGGASGGNKRISVKQGQGVAASAAAYEQYQRQVAQQQGAGATGGPGQQQWTPEAIAKYYEDMAKAYPEHAAYYQQQAAAHVLQQQQMAAAAAAAAGRDKGPGTGEPAALSSLYTQQQQQLLRQQQQSYPGAMGGLGGAASAELKEGERIKVRVTVNGAALNPEPHPLYIRRGIVATAM
jgi:hypothetical protein